MDVGSAPLSLHFDSRGRAVQKPRLMPLRTAQSVARQLQARHIGLVAVHRGRRPPAGAPPGAPAVFIASTLGYQFGQVVHGAVNQGYL